MRRTRWRDRFESLSRDFIYAIKAMRRAPGFAVAAVSTIALGVGANTVVFSLLNVLLLQPLDANHPDELVRIYTSEGRALRSDRDRLGASSYADYADLRQSPALAGLIAFMPVSGSAEINGQPTRLQARAVSENYFSMLGRPPVTGGWKPGEPEVIVSHRLWQTTLGADPMVIGRTIELNGHPVRIAGVTSPAFKGIEPSDIDLYIQFTAAPAMVGRPGLLTDRGERSIRLLGRLAPGATQESAEAALNGMMQSLGTQFPTSNAKRIVTVREARSIVPLELAAGAMPIAALVFGATLIMLVLCGVNVAAVLLARTIRRRRELAVRLSLGATPLRLVRQLVAESVVLACAAAIVVVALVSLLPLAARALGVPVSVQPTVGATVFGYAIAVALGFGMLFGLAPAIAGMRAAIANSVRTGGNDARPAKVRAQRVLVACQIALSMLLLIVGGAVLASLERQQRIDPGFPVAGLIVANFEDPLGPMSVERERAFIQLAVERLNAIPGVTSVSVGSMAPLTSDGMRSTLHIPGYAEQPDEDMEISLVIAGPDYFRTLGIPLRRGRELTWTDTDTMPRVVINESMARRYWGERDPVGTHVRLGGSGGTAAEVIGITADARFYSLAEPPRPTYFIQRARLGGETVLIRTQGDASALLLSVRGSMSRNDVPLIMSQLRTMTDILRESLVITRAISQTLMTMGILAVLLAAVGLYGVVSYVMAGRTREFGVRIALGATPSLIMRMVLGYGMRLSVIGGVIGTILGFGALRLIQGMLFGAASSAWLAAVFALVLSAVTLVACTIPALRATAVSPVRALRSE